MSRQGRGPKGPGFSGGHAENSLTFPPVTCQLIRLTHMGRQKRRGPTALEYAVIAPVFLLLVFGMIEYGRLRTVEQILANAAQQGVEQAVLAGTTSAQVNQTINDYLAGTSASGARVRLNPIDPETADSGEPVTVTITIPFNRVSWLPSPAFLGDTNLNARSVMRRENVQSERILQGWEADSVGG